MKSLRFLTIATIVLVTTACVNGQMRRTVRGDGNVVKRDRKTESFTGIKVSTGIDVYLRQGNDESLAVEADENLHEYIITEVRGGVLNVYTDANIRDAERKRVYVTMKEVNSVRTTSAGDVIGETPDKNRQTQLSASSAGDIKLNVTAREIEVNISSSGDMTLEGEADVLKADLSSAGDLNAYELKVREADVSSIECR